MRKNEEYNLKNITKENPFRIPEGYMEGLTARIMKQIPEETTQVKPITVSLMDRIRPFIYMAAMFAGLGLFFKAIAYLDSSEEAISADSLLVNIDIPDKSLYPIQQDDLSFEDEEYLNYIEDQYADALIQEELEE